MDKKTVLLQNSLERLYDIHEKLKSLTQWNQLKQDEWNRQPFGTIRFVDHTDRDISNLYGDFTFTAGRSMEVLNSIKQPSAEIIRLKKKINAICCQIYYFGSGVNFV